MKDAPLVPICFPLVVIVLLVTSTVYAADRLNSITYRLSSISCRWLNENGGLERQYEKDEDIDYRLTKLNTNNPILYKSHEGDLVETVTLIKLSDTTQGNIYLGEKSRVGNIVLITVFPKHRLVVRTSQYFWSHQKYFVLTQGYAMFQIEN